MYLGGGMKSTTIVFDCFLYTLILNFQYAEYEQVVVEDRIEKEKARRKAEAEAEELKAAVRVRSNSQHIYLLLLHIRRDKHFCPASFIIHVLIF